MNLIEKFGHKISSWELNDDTIYHRKILIDDYAYCNKNIKLCCCTNNINFRTICKRCWKMLSKKEQEELVHYFCVKRLKG